MLHAMSRFFVAIVQRYLPDAYLFAVILTFIAFAAALALTGKGFMDLIIMWGNGLYGILAFAMQMILILVTGHALASSKPIKKFLTSLASIPTNGGQAAMMNCFAVGVASFFNWGFGLVVGALLARELAKKVKNMDYAFVVAAGYSGFVIWHGGISGSIPLAVATKGHLVEKLTGIIPTTATIFSSWNLIITWTIIITLPILFKLMTPPDSEVRAIDPALLVDAEPPAEPKEKTLATMLENSVIINMAFGAMGVLYLGNYFMKNGMGNLSLNIVIMVFFIAGGVINFFVPSGGGQWIVQGPINIPAGLALGVDPAKVAMSISYGDQWTNMIQPFWALPLLGIAQLGVRDIMGYCCMTLIWSGIIMGAGLLLL